MSSIADAGGKGPFRSPGWNLAVSTFAFTLCFAAWSLISPFAKTFKHDLHLSYTEALFLTAVPVVLGSLLRIPVGTLTDRYGGRLMFSVLLAFSAVPTVLFGYAHSYWALIGTGFLLGVAGSSFAVGVPFVANWYGQERQGFAIGLYGMGNVGTAIAFFSAPAIVNHWGRPTLGWIAAGVLLGGAALTATTAHDAPTRRPPTHYREVLGAGWRLYRLAFFYFITFGGFVALFLLLPTVLQDWFDYSKGEASARAAGFVIAATVARPVGGWFSDRVGAFPVLVLCFAGVAIDAAVLATLAAGAADRSGDDRVPHARRLPRLRQRRRLQARADGVPRERRRGGRDRRRRRRPRRLLPARRSSASSRTRRARTRTASSDCSCSSRSRSRSPSGCCAPRPRPSSAGSRTRRRMPESPLTRRRFFGERDPLGGGVERARSRRARVGVVLPRPLAARSRRALDARGQLHRLVLLEDPRQGRDRRLGDAADRLPVERARRARVRAARLPARRLASPGTSTRRCASATRTCAACCSTSTARRSPAPAIRSRRGPTSSTTP